MHVITQKIAKLRIIWYKNVKDTIMLLRFTKNDLKNHVGLEHRSHIRDGNVGVLAYLYV